MDRPRAEVVIDFLAAFAFAASIATIVVVMV